MLQSQTLIIFLVFFTLSSLDAKSAVSQLTIRDKTVFIQARHAMDDKNWQLAQSLLNGLHNQIPENLSIRNNLAIVLFNQGKIEQSQKLFIAIIEDSKTSAIAYKNLKKLYAYSAAKTYSKGLNLLKPVDLPELYAIGVNKQVEKETNSEVAMAVKKDALNVAETAKTSSQVKKVGLIKPSSEPVLSITKPPITDSLIDNKKREKNVSPKKDKKLYNAEKEVLVRLEQWRKYWVSGDSEGYISLYSRNYSPQGKSRFAWVKNRKEKVIKTKRIQVTLSNPMVYVNKNGTRANIKFDQRYSSKNYADKVQKRLYWVKEQGEWFIERESVIKIM